MRIQLGEQVLALGKELWRFEMAVPAIAVLMQVLHRLQGVLEPAQVFFNYHRTHPQPSRSLTGKGSDFSTIAEHEIGFLWRQRIECRRDLACRLHQ
ncbi:hypothetical protein D3C86_1918110 [compost metagenome]